MIQLTNPLFDLDLTVPTVCSRMSSQMNFGYRKEITQGL